MQLREKLKFDLRLAFVLAVILAVAIEFLKPSFLEGWHIFNALVSSESFIKRVIPLLIFATLSFGFFLCAILLVRAIWDVVRGKPNDDIAELQTVEPTESAMPREKSDTIKVEPLPKAVSGEEDTKIYIDDRTAVTVATKSNIRTVQKKYVVNAICTHKALYDVSGIHYTNLSNNYHVGNLFNLNAELLKDSSFSLLIEGLYGELADDPSFSIHNVRHVLFNKKKGVNTSKLINRDINQLLATKLMEKILVKIPSSGYQITQGISFDEETGTVNPELIEPSELRGANIILIESLVIFPDTIVNTVRGLQSLGANVYKVLILVDGTFDGTSSRIDLQSSCKIDAADVRIALLLNLKLNVRYQCQCPPNSKLVALKYYEY